MQQRRDITEGLDDAALLRACLAGDQDAWTILVTRYTRLVYSIALKSGLNEVDASDVVQDVFTIVLRRLESLEHPDRFSAWLITTTHRESWRARKARRDHLTADGVEPVDPDPTAEALVVAWEHASLTHQALARLGERCARLLDLLFLHDAQPGYEAIAAELGIAIGSIGPIRGRCLKQLKGHLADLGVVDFPH
ncbi:MAG: sigma-70 family RNA polymerase sigma factor [Chloroflexota bacterium]|nr:sigma-70 family RNA polymerase sigma factor [Chloroflexota bacterium]